MRKYSILLSRLGGVALGVSVAFFAPSSFASAPPVVPSDTANSVGTSKATKSIYSVYGGHHSEDFLPSPKTATTKVKTVTKRKKYAQPALALPRGFWLLATPIVFIAFFCLIIDMIKGMKEEKSDNKDTL